MLPASSLTVLADIVTFLLLSILIAPLSVFDSSFATADDSILIPVPRYLMNSS